MPSCCVPNCNQIGGHQFPRDGKLKTLWLKAIRRVKFDPKSGARVCHKHFKEDDYEKIGKYTVADPATWEMHVTCNSCEEPIEGFRYLCVECVKYEQCARCEAMREHDHHYMLRVPGPRPEGELRGVAAAVRAALTSRQRLTAEETEIREPVLKVKVEIDPYQQDPLDPDTQPIPDQATVYQELLSPTGSERPGSARYETTLLPRPAPRTPPAPRTRPAVTSACIKITNNEQRALPKTLKVVTSLKDKSTCAMMLRKIKSMAPEKPDNIQLKRNPASDSGGTVPLPIKLLKQEPDSADDGDSGDPSIPSSSTFNNIPR